MPFRIGGHGGTYQEGSIGGKTCGGKGVSHGLIRREIIQVKGTAGTEALRFLRWELVWNI